MPLYEKAGNLRAVQLLRDIPSWIVALDTSVLNLNTRWLSLKRLTSDDKGWPKRPFISSAVKGCLLPTTVIRPTAIVLDRLVASSAFSPKSSHDPTNIDRAI